MCYAVEPITQRPKIKIAKRIPIIEIIRPAIASPLGFLNMPTTDSISASNQNNQPKTGSHPINKEIIANTKPTIPIGFDSFFSC